MPKGYPRLVTRQSQLWSWMNSGISFKKTHKLWIWKAVDYETVHLLDWKLGGRDAITFQRLFQCLEQPFTLPSILKNEAKPSL